MFVLKKVELRIIECNFVHYTLYECCIFADYVIRVSPEMTQHVEWPIECYDLISACLEIDPRQRITASHALLHPFLNTNNF